MFFHYLKVRYNNRHGKAKDVNGRVIYTIRENKKFIRFLMAKNKLTLKDLLDKCDKGIPISREELEWEQMKPVGKEYGSGDYHINQVVMENMNAKESVEALLKIVNA